MFVAEKVLLLLVISLTDYSNVKWASWRLKSHETRLFIQRVIELTATKKH